MGSSVGISKVENREEELQEALEEAFVMMPEQLLNRDRST